MKWLRSSNELLREAALAIIAVMSFAAIMSPVSVGQVPTPARMEPAITPPANTGVLVDPSGTYAFYNVSSTSYLMNLASYQALLKDPYSTPPNGTLQYLGSMVRVSTIINQAAGQNSIVYGEYWSGAGGGDCTSMSVDSGQDGFVCNGSAGTVGTSGVYSSSLTWQSSCYSGSSCITSYWTGLSSHDSGPPPLIQSGITVCVNDLAFCSYSGHNGHNGALSWEAWFEYVASPGGTNGPLYTPTNPTTINGVAYEFVFAFVNSQTQPTFQWTVGSWNYYQSYNDPNVPQTDFQQTEGIMEQAITGGPQQMVMWTPNPNVMTGWWETGKWCGCTYQSGYLGSSYTTGLYYITSNGLSTGTVIAKGATYSSTQFSIWV